MKRKTILIEGKKYSMPCWLADTLHWWITLGVLLTAGLFIVGMILLLGGMPCNGINV